MQYQYNDGLCHAGRHPRLYLAKGANVEKLDAFAAEIEQENITVETVIVSFGTPTNRQMSEGYWESPKTGTTSAGKDVVVAPSPEKGWSEPRVVEPPNGKIVSSRRSPGMHGGYVYIEVSVPIEEVKRCEND